MLNLEILAIFAVVCVVLVAVMLLVTWRRANSAYDYAVGACEWCQQANPDAVSKKQIADLTVGLTDLADAYHSLLKQHKKLVSRLSMRELREKRRDGQGDGSHALDADPVPTRDKVELRKQATRDGLLR